MATISGEVRDENNDLLADCVVRAYRRDNGALLVAGLSGDGSPEGPGDPDYASVSLLLHCDGTDGSTTFTDHSPTPKTVTAYGNAHIETDQSKFGGTSAYFDGANDGLMLADLALGTDAFTIEMWVKTSSSVQYAQLIGNEPGFTLMVNHESSTSGNFALYVSGGLLLTSVSGDWNDGAWHHIALVRLVNTFTLYTDGNANGTGTYTGSLSGSNLWLGRNNVYTPRNLVGYLDDIRITKGVARYTANFTPPTEAFLGYAEVPAKPLGEYTLTTAYTGEVNVIALDPAGGTTFNDLILRTTPV